MVDSKKGFRQKKRIEMGSGMLYVVGDWKDLPLGSNIQYSI